MQIYHCTPVPLNRSVTSLDRRIKEKLNTDLRTANIITDILAEAGVVENVRINNPETGRQVKGTRLLDSWIWTSAVENNIDSKTNEVEYTRLDEIPKSDLNKQTTGNNLSRENYLNNSAVREFSEWLELRLDKPGAFKHGYYLKKARSHWSCSCLYEAYEKYWWPFSMYCPVGDRHIGGSGLSVSFNYLTQLAGISRSAVRDNDVELTQKGALAMMAWGGVLNKNRERILNMGHEVCTFFKEVQEKLSLPEVRLNDHNDIFINSGFTKLYFLLIDDFIMYDGRVGAALGLLGRQFAEDSGLKKIPEEIEFAFGSGKVGKSGKQSVNRRNPSIPAYKLPAFTGNQQRHLNDNIKASWLLKNITDRTKSRLALLPQDPPLNERLTAIQSALFMIGYDVRGKNVE